MFLFVLAVCMFFGIGAMIVANGRGANGGLWMVLGFLFGPFGLALSFAAGSQTECPACRKRVHPEATRCPYCQFGIGGGTDDPSDKNDEVLRNLIRHYEGGTGNRPTPPPSRPVELSVEQAGARDASEIMPVGGDAVKDPVMNHLQLMFTIALVVIIGAFALNYQPSSGTRVEAASQEGRDTTPTLDCYCGRDEAHASQAYSALRRDDKAAVIGMISRDQIMALTPTDQVHVVIVVGSMARIRVVTGYHTGQRCWIPAGLLK